MRCSCSKRLCLPILSFAIAFLLWAWITWPLVTVGNRGISASAKNPENAAPQQMIAGDHLQMLYHLWLGYDSAIGKTPWSTNLYEFNTGDDAARKAYSTYYFPFQLFYGVGHVLGGHAVGMNLTAILSLAIGLGCTVLWLRRWFPEQPWLIWGAAIAGQALPYRWHNLMNGSPTGFAMMWGPVLLLGFDIWLRDRKARGAALVAAGVYFSGWSDSHAIFFNALFCAAWLPVAVFITRSSFRITRADLLAWLRSSWPLWIGMGLVLLQVMSMKTLNEGTEIEAGRSLGEVALFSPHLREAYSMRGWGGATETYLGRLLIAVLAVGLLVWIVRAFRRERGAGWSAGTLAVLLLGLAAAVLFSTGPRNPFGDIWWVRLTKLLPPLGMIRQPAKIYLLLPPLVSLAVALSLAAAKPPRLRRLLSLLVPLLLFWSFTSRIHPRICLLSGGNPAYAAVAADAPVPRALVLPLWPGNSHWSSLYQYEVMRPRLRMVNGYNPVLNLAYVKDIFERFHPFNQGSFREEDLDELLRRGVTHILLHENAFPDKVSPFSVGDTLRALLQHPRLRLLERNGPVWAFRLLAQDDRAAVLPASWTLASSVRWWQSAPGTHLDQARFPIALPFDRRVWLRGVGPGVINLELRWGDQHIPLRWELADGTHWQSLPLLAQEGFHFLELNARVDSGDARLQLAHLSPDDWHPVLDEARILPAAVFFHAGFSHADGWVEFQPEQDPHDAILYGPALPLEPGRYQADFVFESDAPAGTQLGLLRTRHLPGEPTETPVKAGEATRLLWTQPEGALFNLEFIYNGQAPLRIHTLHITPLPNE
jgi:hypothetical protein